MVRLDSTGSDKGPEVEDQKLNNQFSFVERATQTSNHKMKVNRFLLIKRIEKKVSMKSILFQLTEVQTEPPPQGRLSETVNQFKIFDSYTAYEIAKNKEEEKETQKEQKDAKSEKISFLGRSKESSNEGVNNKMLKAVKILERMVNQNEYDDIAQGREIYKKRFASQIFHRLQIL